MLKTYGVILSLLCTASIANGADYYNRKWFDYPDPVTLPRVQNGCAHWASGSSMQCKFLKCHHTTWKVCTNPTHIVVSLLRKDVVFVVSGPSSPSEAVEKAVAGYAATCAATAIAAAQIAGAASSTTMVGEVPAAAAALPTAFETCVSAVSVAGAAGGIVHLLDIHIDTSGNHWSPI